MLVIAIVAGLIGVRLHDAALLRQAALRASTDSARIATQTLEASLRVAAHRDSVWADSIARLRRADALLQAHARTLIVRGDSLSETLHSFSDTVAQIRPLLAVKDSVINAQGAQITSLAQALALSERRVAQKDSALQAVNAALQRQVMLTVAWQKAAQPSLLKRAEGAVPWLAAAYLAGRLTR